MNTEFYIQWGPGEETVEIMEIDHDAKKIINKLSLTPPRHGKLYYALQDWFGDPYKPIPQLEAAQMAISPLEPH